MWTPPVVIRSTRLARLLLALGVGAALTIGCERRLILRQGEYINNAMHAKRPEGRRTGEPLEVTLVLFLPEFYDIPANEALRPKQSKVITSQDWYERRPGSPNNPKAFEIPEDRIFLLTDEPRFYGTKVGGALHGGKLEGTLSIRVDDESIQVGDQKPVKIKRLDNPLDLKAHPFNDERCAIYLFGRFVGENGEVLPVKPEVITPKNISHEQEITIQVDVDKEVYKSNPGQAQYIKHVSTPAGK